VSQEASDKVRAAAATAGCALLAAPVSGNGKVVKAGRLSVVVSGSRAAFEEARPYLEALGEGVSYVGEGELARIVKICHNVFLGVVTQSLAEITVLAEKAGAPRHAFLDFINKSVMGSTFTRYKTPAFVNLDFSPTFTPVLLRKDLDLGLAAARKHDVAMPVAALVREMVQGLIGRGYVDCDFAALLEQQAKASQLALHPENVTVSDGLDDGIRAEAV
jgi:3-hydroxyisobutyrate dehydrogenase-like beta-hydroxyacid dehydrogenase